MMHEKTWYNPEPFWDTQTNPDHHGWLIRVVEQDYDGTMLNKIYAPCPDYFDVLGKDATQEDLDDMIESTAAWEGAIIEGEKYE